MPANNRNIRFADKLSVWVYDKNDMIRNKKNIHHENIRYSSNKNTYDASYNRQIWVILVIIIVVTMLIMK